MRWTSLCEIGELTEGRGKYVEIDGFRLAVFLEAGRIDVTDDACPHAGVSLASGVVKAGCLTCPRHNWSFDLKDGTLNATGAPLLHVYKSRILHRDNDARLVQAELPMF